MKSPYGHGVDELGELTRFACPLHKELTDPPTHPFAFLSSHTRCILHILASCRCLNCWIVLNKSVNLIARLENKSNLRVCSVGRSGQDQVRDRVHGVGEKGSA